jgi:hypothetical protein
MEIQYAWVDVSAQGVHAFEVVHFLSSVWSNSKKDKTLTMNQIKHYLSMAKQVMQY